MKFNVGEWVLKPGVKASHCQQVREVRFNADKTAVSLFCVGYKQDERCLDGPALFVTITTPKPDVIRMQTVHYKGTGAKMPAFDLAMDATPLDCEVTDKKITIKSADTSLSCSEKRDSVKPFLSSVKFFADFTCFDFCPAI